MYQALSITEVTTYLGELLEVHPLFSDLWLVGELSEFKRHAASGHCYFSLKDEGALLRGVMWRSAAIRMAELPRSGDRVLAHGKLGLYNLRGDLQIYVDALLPAGVGLLYARFAELKARLAAEGLFSAERKRPLPALPRRIALVTAPDGAALQDLLNILRRRCPLTEVLLVPCLVQGERAPASIVAALSQAYQAGVDLIILARGGGAPEDLWAFNDETVARAVFASPVPLISGVGHATDTTIVDYVADMGAPTPSAAAELAVPELAELRDLVAEAQARMTNALTTLVTSRRAKLTQALHTIERHAPLRRLARQRQQLDDLARRMERTVGTAASLRQLRLRGLADRLAALSPLATLARGYAIARRADTGFVVTAPEHALPGTPLQITVRDGELTAIIQPPAQAARPEEDAQ